MGKKISLKIEIDSDSLTGVKELAAEKGVSLDTMISLVLDMHWQLAQKYQAATGKKMEQTEKDLAVAAGVPGLDKMPKPN